MIIDFGKYRDHDIDDVYKIDPQYLAWLVNQEHMITPDMKHCIEEKLEGADLSYRLKWGKHKGKTLAWVKEHNATYLDWLSNNAFVKGKCPRLLRELRAIQEEV